MKKVLYIFFVSLALAVGLYPALYLYGPLQGSGVLSLKKDELLGSAYYMPAFYFHIVFGGIALLCGWVQFNERWRQRQPRWHKRIGWVYVLSVSLSGATAIVLALFSYGGMPSHLGFLAMAAVWLATTYLAFRYILRQAIEPHRFWMMRSYAVCFGAVTFRFWEPVLEAGAGFSAATAFAIASWLCWMPNLLFAEWLVRKRKNG